MCDSLCNSFARQSFFLSHRSSRVLDLTSRGHLRAHKATRYIHVFHMTSPMRAQIGLKATMFNELVEVSSVWLRVMNVNAADSSGRLCRCFVQKLWENTARDLEIW